MTKPRTLRFGVVNAPERTDKSKARLRAPAWRARRILRWRRQLDVDVLGLIESGSVMLAALKGRRRLRSRWAKANTVIRGHRLGNGAVIDQEVRVLDVGGFSVRLKRRRLHMLVLLCADRETGHRFVVMVRHLPRNVEKIDPGRAARRAIDSATRRHAEAYRAAGLPVVALSDSNGAPPHWAGSTTAGRHGVESIQSSGFWIPRDGADALPGAIDHPAAVWADLCPWLLDTTTTKLPKVS